jgi:ACR3 family arsenite efflux pump ArsB
MAGDAIIAARPVTMSSFLIWCLHLLSSKFTADRATVAGSRKMVMVSRNDLLEIAVSVALHASRGNCRNGAMRSQHG